MKCGSHFLSSCYDVKCGTRFLSSCYDVKCGTRFLSLCYGVKFGTRLLSLRRSSGFLLGLHCILVFSISCLNFSFGCYFVIV